MTYNFNYDFELTQLSLANSKISQHKDRVSKITDVNLYYLDYFNLLEIQKSSDLDYPKWEPSIDIYYPRTPSNRDINNVLAGLFSYTGIKKKDGFSFYEFVNNTNQVDFKNYKFLYFEINSSNKDLLKPRLPSLIHWDRNSNYLDQNYPDSFQLIESSVVNFDFYFEFLVEDSNHPFLPGFYFSGKSISLSNGTVLYEYFDENGVWGIRDAVYLSPLRPNIDFPLGHPKLGCLERDNNSLIGKYPAKGNTYFIGTYTGYKTNSLYSPYKTFYLYERLDGSAFLLDSLPNENSDFVAFSLLVTGGEPIFYISDDISASTLEMKDLSVENFNFIFDEL